MFMIINTNKMNIGQMMIKKLKNMKTKWEKLKIIIKNKVIMSKKQKEEKKP